jgi:hypothetical protein
LAGSGVPLPLPQKMSHEFSRTEIERFSNCCSFRSVSVSLQAERRKNMFGYFVAAVSLSYT